jgi:hypothetical protein
MHCGCNEGARDGWPDKRVSIVRNDDGKLQEYVRGRNFKAESGLLGQRDGREPTQLADIRLDRHLH